MAKAYKGSRKCKCNWAPDKSKYWIDAEGPVTGSLYFDGANEAETIMAMYELLDDEIERLRRALRMTHRFLSEHDLSSELSETALIEAMEAEDTARAALENKDE